MRAVDTDVVVRFLTGDDPEQAGRMRVLIDAGDVFVSAMVLLESDWVLRSAYGFAGARVASALRVFAGLPGVVVGDPDRIAHCLRAHAASGRRATVRVTRWRVP